MTTNKPAPRVRKAVLAAGGTGGHMFPAEALARELRARGVSVVLVTERFTTLAKASMRGNGVPNAPMVVLPKTELTEYVEPDVVRSVAKEAVELIIAQLRGPEAVKNS